jgi:hypothetical protein
VLVHGPIPDLLTIDHYFCRYRPCCNPLHLQLLPNVENATMNANWFKTACKRGHPFDADNTHINGRGHRICRACGRLRRLGALA